MRTPILLLLLLVAIPASAQRENNVWYFGTGAGIDFNGPVPVVLNDGRINAMEGCASVADRASGRILFYTNGDSVWNREHRLMPNGTGLPGYFSSTQSALIVPMPGDSLRYYIFTTDGITNVKLQQDGIRGAAYSIVDMRLDGGRGDVARKNVRLFGPTMEKITAIRHCNGEDYWVIAHGLPWNAPDGRNITANDSFHVYRVSRAGVSPAVVQPIGIRYADGTYGDALGYMKGSPDGSMLAVVGYYPASLQLLSFDRSTGRLSNPMAFDLPAELAGGLLYGLSFSPDSRKLYISNLSFLYQYDLSVRAQRTIERTLVRIAGIGAQGSNVPAGHQLGPDGRIYLALRDKSVLHVITRPNESGTACGFQYGAIDLGSGISRSGLPNMIDTDIFPDAADAGPDLHICRGSRATLSATGGMRYRWLPDPTLSCTDCASPIAAPSVTTRYRVEIFTLNGCSRFDSVTITVDPLPALDAGADRTICIGDSTRLHADGDGPFIWSAGPAMSCTDCADPLVAPSTTTAYIVTATGANGCRAEDSIRVTVVPRAHASAGGDAIVCAGSAVHLAGSGGMRYLWTPSTGLSCDTCADPFASPREHITYTLTVWNEGGCSSSDQVNVQVLPVPDVAASPDTAICIGGEVRLGVTGATSYRWRFHPDLSCLDCADPVVHPAVTTTYIVAGANANGCEVLDSVTVTVGEPPALSLPVDPEICAGTELRLVGSGAERYRWSAHPDLSCLDCADPVVRPVRTTTYHLVGYSRSGCGRLDSVTVHVRSPKLRLSGDSAVCPGSTAHVTAEGAESYRWWSESGSLACATCSEQTIMPMTTTKLHVEGTDAGGCMTTDSFEIRVVDRPEMAVSGGRDICAGEPLRLSATGATDYIWEPADGLSCTHCPDPVATPNATTIYRVTGRLAGGCADTVSVTIGVREPSAAIASLPRDTRLSIGGTGKVMLTLDRDISADTLLFTLAWRRGVVGLESVGVTATAIADGWKAELIEQTESGYRSRLVRSQPGVLAAGALLTLTLRGYLGDSATTELPFTLTASSACTAIEPRPGSVTIDSICGLNVRLIVAAKGLLRLDAPVPHPIADQALIRYAVPFDATDVTLRLIDAAGHMRMLSSGYHAAGEYEVVLDASETAPGVYVVRLNVGELVRQVEVVVVR